MVGSGVGLRCGCILRSTAWWETEMWKEVMKEREIFLIPRIAGQQKHPQFGSRCALVPGDGNGSMFVTLIRSQMCFYSGSTLVST